jgi:hypothetical protein
MEECASASEVIIGIGLGGVDAAGKSIRGR